MTISASSWGRRLSVTVVLGLSITGLLSTTAAATPAEAEGTVVGADAVGSVPGRYIVVLRDGSAPMTATAQDFAGSAVTRTYATIPAFTATMTALEARRLAADPSVRLVEQDRRIGIAYAPAQAGPVAEAGADSTQRNPDWGLDRIDQRSDVLSGTYTPTDDGSAVHAYVIDTGVRITNREFGGRASYGYDFVNYDRIASDCNGHGTHVAGTIGGSAYGVAKKVKIVAVRVLDCSGQGYVSDIVNGLDWVTQHATRPAVANMSLGGGNDPVLDQAVAASIASGITYTVAAGNDGANAAGDSPADVSSAITVGATNPDDTRAGFSNYGADLDLFAPGVNIESAWDTSDTATQVLSGTSMAAPHVAGAVALLLAEHPNWSPATVRNHLVGVATAGVVGDAGVGSPNRLLFTAAPPGAPVISTASVTAGGVGRAYRAQLMLASGLPGSWHVASGRLPSGLRLSTSGVISGTPRAAGTGTVTVRFTDFVPASVTRTLTIRINRR